MQLRLKELVTVSISGQALASNTFRMLPAASRNAGITSFSLQKHVWFHHHRKWNSILAKQLYQFILHRASPQTLQEPLLIPDQYQNFLQSSGKHFSSSLYDTSFLSLWWGWGRPCKASSQWPLKEDKLLSKSWHNTRKEKFPSPLLARICIIWALLKSKQNFLCESGFPMFLQSTCF